MVVKYIRFSNVYVNTHDAYIFENLIKNQGNVFMVQDNKNKIIYGGNSGNKNKIVDLSIRCAGDVFHYTRYFIKTLNKCFF